MLLLVLITALFFFSFIAALFLVAGLGRLVKQSREAANRNAALWAEADARANVAETKLGRLEAAHAMLQKCYEDMRDFAAKAIDVAKEKHFPQKNDQFVVFHCSQCGTVSSWSREMVIGSRDKCPKCEALGGISDMDKFYHPATTRTPNFITVDCRNCAAPVARAREEFPVNCPVCGTVVDPVLDAGEVE